MADGDGYRLLFGLLLTIFWICSILLVQCEEIDQKFISVELVVLTI